MKRIINSLIVLIFNTAMGILLSIKWIFPELQKCFSGDALIETPYNWDKIGMAIVFLFFLSIFIVCIISIIHELKSSDGIIDCLIMGMCGVGPAISLFAILVASYDKEKGLILFDGGTTIAAIVGYLFGYLVLLWQGIRLEFDYEK